MQLYGTKALVMGLGVHGGGLGVARWLIRAGAQVTVTDMASAEMLAGPLAALRQVEREYDTRVRYVLGEHRAEDFTNHEVVVINPAVRPTSPWLALARAAGAHIETEMTLFFRRCPGPILGITGTKGKTTTTLLTGAILRQRYPDTVIAGNLRVSALEALDQITPQTPVVLELSSFQLVGLGAAGLSPQYACITNISPDHLNYHGSFDEYVRAKQHIFMHQPTGGVVVLNQDLLEPAGAGAQAEGAACMQHAVPSASILRTFSTHPESTADCRITSQGGVTFCGEHMFDVVDIQLPGAHNRANVLAATALARSFGTRPDTIRAAIRSFHGVEHRLELVDELDNVRYVNDTTATNPAAAQAALASFDAPIVLLAGGADKDLEFGALAQAIVQRVKALVLLAGSATAQLERAVKQAAAHTHGPPSTFIFGPYDDFAAAIRAAQSLAVPGDVVLLSPGCASFGMFQNEFHRGEEFRRIVRQDLSAVHGPSPTPDSSANAGN